MRVRLSGIWWRSRRDLGGFFGFSCICARILEPSSSHSSQSHGTIVSRPNDWLKQGTLLNLLLSARSFAIYNPEERKKPEFRRAARKSRGNEICREREKSPRKARAFSSLLPSYDLPFTIFLCFSFSPSLSFLSRKGFSLHGGKDKLAPNKRRKF